jgi:hypothetical protein
MPSAWSSHRAPMISDRSRTTIQSQPKIAPASPSSVKRGELVSADTMVGAAKTKFAM